MIDACIKTWYHFISAVTRKKFLETIQTTYGEIRRGLQRSNLVTSARGDEKIPYEDWYSILKILFPHLPIHISI